MSNQIISFLYSIPLTAKLITVIKITSDLWVTLTTVKKNLPAVSPLFRSDCGIELNQSACLVNNVTDQILNRSECFRRPNLTSINAE